jgi:hypothetical protein
MRFRIAEHEGKAFIIDGETCFGPYYPDKVLQVWLSAYSAQELKGRPYTRNLVSTLTQWSTKDYLYRISPRTNLAALSIDDPLSGVFVRWVRQKNKMTLVAFAEACGVTEQTAVNWEQGHSPCTSTARLVVLSHA